MPLLWGRAVVYGLLTEGILMIVFLISLASGMPAGVNTAIVLGLLIGGAAFAIYMAMYATGRVFQPNAGTLPAAYWIAHALRFAGGALPSTSEP